MEKGKKMVIALEQREVYSEVLEVLRHMNKEYVDKIPKKLIMFFYDNCSLDYEFKMTKSIGEEELKKETLQILAILNLNYWASKQKKDELIMAYSLNNQKTQEQLNSKLEQENIYTKIDVSKPDDNNASNLPAVISTSFNILKKVLIFVKDLIIKIFGD